MKCPTCAAWASVKDTRQTPANTTRRRYECANGHGFRTLERVLVKTLVAPADQPTQGSL